MNTNLTHIAFILDRSGSMHSMAEEAIGGFNGFLSDQQEEEGEARLSLILFDNEYTPLVENTPIKAVQPLDADTYHPRGMTALLDAMGRTIDTLGQQLAEMPEEERPGTVIIVTLTDGLENSSHDYSYKKLGEMIQHQKETYQWEFLFLGADITSTEQSAKFKLERSERVQYSSVQEGMSFSSRHISARRRAKQKSKKIGF